MAPETPLSAPSASKEGFGELLGHPREHLGLYFGALRGSSESFSEQRESAWSSNDEKVRIIEFLM